MKNYILKPYFSLSYFNPEFVIVSPYGKCAKFIAVSWNAIFNSNFGYEL